MLHVSYNGGQPLGLAGIVDGTANTVAVGEKRMNRRFLGAYQSDDNEGYTSGWDHDVIRWTDRDPRPDWLDPSNAWGEQRFGSSHPGGFYMGFCDGSVRFLAYTIDPVTFNYLGDRRDGQVVSGL